MQLKPPIRLKHAKCSLLDGHASNECLCLGRDWSDNPRWVCQSYRAKRLTSSEFEGRWDDSDTFQRDKQAIISNKIEEEKSSVKGQIWNFRAWTSTKLQWPYAPNRFEPIIWTWTVQLNAFPGGSGSPRIEHLDDVAWARRRQFCLEAV